MTDARSPETPPADDPKAGAAAEPDTETAAEPEAPAPWTAEKVVEWNRYYDIYVVLAVLLLTFLGSMNLLTSSSLWTHLQAGRQLSTNFAPTVDDFSYTEPGQRWVHISWLSDLLHYQVYSFIAGFAPADALAVPPAVPGANAPAAEPPAADPSAAEQWGVGGLTVMDAVLRVLTVIVLLAIRRKGPGLWWAALCAAVALAVLPVPAPNVTKPIVLLIGGIAESVIVGSRPWGQFFAAIELLCLFRAFEQGRARKLYVLIPLFLLWANVDESFIFGLAILAASVAGLAISGRMGSPKEKDAASPPIRTGLIVLAACAAACLVNPSFHRIYLAAIGSILPIPGWEGGPLLRDQLSIFGRKLSSRPMVEVDALRLFFLLLVGVGYATFILNRRRFSLPRFLVYSVAVAFWALVAVYEIEFALVFASVLTLNGQEWYQDRFGTEGHLGRGWAVWSTGGRAVTLAVLGVVLVFRVVLGWWAEPGESQFGFGFQPGQFAFEAADLLRDAPIRGNVFNYGLSEGDAIIWRGYPKRKSFIDSRRHVFGKEVVDNWDAICKAVRDDDVDTWKRLLDRYEVSVVMVDTSFARNSYAALLNNRNWVRFYDDGDHALFGRGDAGAEDLAYFRRHELNVENLAYKNPEPPPSTEKLPRATGEIDALYRGGTRARANPHTLAAARWMRPSDIAHGTPYLAEPGRCFLAIREARKALHVNPNESAAYRQLADAYGTLLTEESALILGVEPTQANLQSMPQIPSQINLLPNRYRQLVTALRSAVLTTPSPETPEDRRDLADLNDRLLQVYLNQNALDLARDCLDAWMKLSNPADYNPQQYAARVAQLTALNNHLNEVQRAVTNLAIESQAGPLQKASLARSQGAIGMAIQQLKEALDGGMNPALVKPTLLDLYCQVGEPDQALELWTSGNFDDRTLSDGPGTAALRQGRVFLLVGNYDSALAVWTREAIPRLRTERTLGAPLAVRALLEGEPTATTRTFLQIPDQVATQAVWEFEVGMVSLEAGQPVDETASHLTNALKLVPTMGVRPVIAYYLKKLGRPVPDLPADAKKTDAKAAEPPRADTIKAPEPAKASATPK